MDSLLSGRERSSKRPKAETNFAPSVPSDFCDRLLSDSNRTAHQLGSLFTAEAVVKIKQVKGLIADVTYIRVRMKPRTLLELEHSRRC